MTSSSRTRARRGRTRVYSTSIVDTAGCHCGGERARQGREYSRGDYYTGALG